MKLFKNFAVAFMLLALTSQYSFSNSPDDPNADLRNAVTKLLLHPQLDTRLDESVRISFFVTADDKLVVLKTDARTKKLDEFIKGRMNYKEIKVKDLEINRIFHMKVRFMLDQESSEE